VRRASKAGTGGAEYIEHREGIFFQGDLVLLVFGVE
jgi:hypothetical protein